MLSDREEIFIRWLERMQWSRMSSDAIRELRGLELAGIIVIEEDIVRLSSGYKIRLMLLESQSQGAK